MNRTAAIVVFVLAVALSAMLLFSLEPMVSRMLLPHFGGSASVWSVALVFFQAALLLGYLYALVLARYLPGRAGVALHVAMLAAGVLFLPVTVTGAAATGSPALGVLVTLAASIGLPFVVLSANAPLLQAWFARSALPGADNPYPLYAASNAGSLAALAAYPFVIEPALGLRQQADVWLGAYVVLIGLVAALLVVRQAPNSDVVRPAASLARRDVAIWIATSAVPSAGLVAVTAHISTNIAAAPFLWVIPLGLYLLSFVVAFSGRAQAWLLPMRVLLGVMIVAAVTLPAFTTLGFLADAALQLAMFLLIALVFHLMLVARRPAAENLTGFYVAMSFGGLVGGVFAAIVAPAIFNWVAEYPLVLVAAAVGAFGSLLSVIPVAVLGGIVLSPPPQTSATYRSFYGVHAIQQLPYSAYRVLRHGQEIHGAQKVAMRALGPYEPDLKPLTYYHEESALSEAIDVMRARLGGGAISLGVVGLGAGSMACLAERDDRLTFFEIDPAILRIAREQFTFLAGCHPDARIDMGDARLQLARSEERFDLLVIDAFSGDSIPTHLITREAMQLYMRRLKPGGMLVLHISNNHLRLNEVVTATARSLGLAVRMFDEDGPQSMESFVFTPTVVAVMAEEAQIADIFDNDDWADPPVTSVRPWTDDHADLFGALKAKLREQ